jgi:hypothetical protein
MKFLQLILFLGLISLPISCGGSSIKSFSGKGKSNSSSKSKNGDGGDEDELDGSGNRKIRNNGQNFLLKTSKQLESAVQACLGGDRTTVRDEILFKISSSEEQAETSQGIAFLSPGDYGSGENIITKSAGMFDGKEATRRTGVSNGVVTIPYLTALQNTANVVAYNCSEAHRNQGSSPELCECDTKDKALKMLSRCLPAALPNTLEDLAKDFAGVCKDDQRAAISSFIASFAFAGAM